MHEFDLVVIGSGPGGQKAAIAAAKLDRKVAVVERPRMLGGVCLNTGTIPSKTLREAVLYLTGLDQREMYGQSYRVKDEITIGDLTARTKHVVSRENDVVRSQLSRNRVTVLTGTARFTSATTVEVANGSGRSREYSSEKVIVATGTKPARPASTSARTVRSVASRSSPSRTPLVTAEPRMLSDPALQIVSRTTPRESRSMPQW